MERKESCLFFQDYWILAELHCKWGGYGAGTRRKEKERVGIELGRSEALPGR